MSQPLGPLRPDDSRGFRAQRAASGTTWPCVACGYSADALTQVDGTRAAPADGDYIICIRCGEVTVVVAVAGGLAVREATTAELQEFQAAGNARHVQNLHQFWAEKRSNP